MQFSTLVLAALASLASAQSGQIRTTRVLVAENGTQTFSPNNIKVAAGEAVQFQFLTGNHTVTQSTFDQPCQPIAMHSNITGFHSGFQPAAASAAQGMMSIFTIFINDTKPIWIYCAQGRHCENGMVMVINEPTGNNKTLANFKSLAAQANTVVPGGGAAPNGGNGATPNGAPGSTTPGAPGNTAVPAGAGMLSAPAFGMLLAAAGFAILL
ncbi:hypothetical protein QBC47DRAFT_217603 [Echria macrotheca]|uniref:Extracellular serine-rich protein n=1 Tax=Echria macrotheca TaxID=438768 RepID=A0AAJ0F4A9_9PEZI|nr:hypothetical protein QBC47DRAFT_217603 [Echria macrotheca]